MTGWLDWWQEAGVGTGVLALLFRLLTRSSPTSIKDKVFSLGSLYIRYERCQADNRALTETIASQNRQLDEWKQRAYGLGYPTGSTKSDSEASETPLNPPPPTPK